MPESEERTTAIGLFLFGHSYAASAFRLHEFQVKATHPDAPIRFLFSHAIELYLKSFLLLKGVSLERLRSKNIGHDIVKLTKMAKEHALDISDTHTGQMALVNEAILDRYIVQGVRTILEPEHLTKICESLHKKIGPLVYQNAGLICSPPSFPAA